MSKIEMAIEESDKIVERHKPAIRKLAESLAADIYLAHEHYDIPLGNCTRGTIEHNAMYKIVLYGFWEEFYLEFLEAMLKKWFEYRKNVRDE